MTKKPQCSLQGCFNPSFIKIDTKGFATPVHLCKHHAEALDSSVSRQLASNLATAQAELRVWEKISDVLVALAERKK